MTKLLLNGLTLKPAAELVAQAKAWLSPPTLEVVGGGFVCKGYDPEQRAYVVTRENAENRASVELNLRASDQFPVVNPALVIKNWGEEGVRISLDGKPVAASQKLRIGYEDRLEGTDLIIWIQTQSSSPLHIKLASAAIR